MKPSSQLYTEIKYPSELSVLSYFFWFRTKTLGKIVLSNNFKNPKREILEEKINNYYYSCGCDTSAKGMILFFMLGGIYVLGFSTTNDWSVTNLLFLIGGITLLGMILGKIYGLLVASKNLRKTIKEIKIIWPK